LDKFVKAVWLEGYRYELIDGRLVVSPSPNYEHADIVDWLSMLLQTYRLKRPDIVNRVSSGPRIFIPGRPDVTVPEPDLAAYHGFPEREQRRNGFSWKKVNPVLVIEVVSPDAPDKDYFRNVDLYEMVPSIREYWIFDPRGGVEQTTLRVYRRRGRKWQKPIDLVMGDKYTTKLLPGFRLVLDPLP